MHNYLILSLVFSVLFSSRRVLGCSVALLFYQNFDWGVVLRYNSGESLAS